VPGKVRIVHISMEYEQLLSDVVAKAKDYQYLAAKEAYEKLVQYLYINNLEKDINVIALLKKNEIIINEMLERAHETQKALDSCALDKSHGIDWIYVSTYLGVTTHYAIQSDGTVAVHLHGLVEDLPFFEQLAVINEIDLFKEWVRIVVD
jgi:hypothetical protein